MHRRHLCWHDVRVRAEPMPDDLHVRRSRWLHGREQDNGYVVQRRERLHLERHMHGWDVRGHDLRVHGKPVSNELHVRRFGRLHGCEQDDRYIVQRREPVHLERHVHGGDVRWHDVRLHAERVPDDLDVRRFGRMHGREQDDRHDV